MFLWTTIMHMLSQAAVVVWLHVIKGWRPVTVPCTPWLQNLDFLCKLTTVGVYN